MNFEFETLLSNGRNISVVGSAEIDFNCECCDKAHIESVEYDSIVDVNTGLDVVVDDSLREELEQETDHHVYGNVEDYISD